MKFSIALVKLGVESRGTAPDTRGMVAKEFPAYFYFLDGDVLLTYTHDKGVISTKPPVISSRPISDFMKVDWKLITFNDWRTLVLARCNLEEAIVAFRTGKGIKYETWDQFIYNSDTRDTIIFGLSAEQICSKKWIIER